MKKIIITLAAVAAAFTAVSCGKEDARKDTIGGIMIDGHEAVDLGDGLLWATCNIGAESETDYGSYFSWGETSEKASYYQNKYKFGTLDPKNPDDFGMNKYNTQDKLTRLLPDDDAATVQWGKSWRTPTSAEFKRLLDTSSFILTWTSKKVKDGMKIYGLEIQNKKSKNSIFLPATGRNFDRKPLYQGEIGSYWSSSLTRDNSGEDAITVDHNEVYLADFLAIEGDTTRVFYRFRHAGFSIRAVANPIK